MKSSCLAQLAAAALVAIGLDAAPIANAHDGTIPICGKGKRITCIVDGDTVWLEGEKIRLMDIDAPEARGRCPAETLLAAAATRELQAVLSSGPITIERHGRDRYGRTLAASGSGSSAPGPVCRLRVWPVRIHQTGTGVKLFTMTNIWRALFHER